MQSELCLYGVDRVTSDCYEIGQCMSDTSLWIMAVHLLCLYDDCCCQYIELLIQVLESYNKSHGTVGEEELWNSVMYLRSYISDIKQHRQQLLLLWSSCHGLAEHSGQASFLTGKVTRLLAVHFLDHGLPIYSVTARSLLQVLSTAALGLVRWLPRPAVSSPTSKTSLNSYS